MLLQLCLLLSGAHADIFHLEKHELKFGTPKIERVAGMYTLEDSPGSARHVTQKQDRDSFIKVDLDFTATEGSGAIEVVIFQAHETDMVGYHNGEYLTYCCTEEHKAKGVEGCETVNRLIVKKLEGIDIMRYDVTFDNNVGKLAAEYGIQTTGEHLLITSNCDSALGTVEMTGVTEWVNPFGYLSGSAYGHLPFYGAMSVVYWIVGLAWFVLNCCNWREIIAVQNLITAVLGLCMVEMMVWYFDYSNLNHTGIRHKGATVFGIILSSTRRSASRLLILAVSMGWGVVRPTLGNKRSRMIVMGVVYFASEAALEIVIRYGQTNVVAEHWRVVLSVPTALVNAIFYWWTFMALAQVKEGLLSRNQKVKLALYTRLTYVLVVSLLAALGFSLYQIWFVYTDRMSVKWSERWLFDDGMEVILYTVILVSVAFLWRPTANSQRYAYSQVALEDDDDDIELQPPSRKPLPTPKFALESDSDDTLSSDGLPGDVDGTTALHPTPRKLD